MDSLLNSISQDVKQRIFECISQAIGEDKQEADAHLELRTHVSSPFLTWVLIYRNLMNSLNILPQSGACGQYCFYMIKKAGF